MYYTGTLLVLQGGYWIEIRDGGYRWTLKSDLTPRPQPSPPHQSIHQEQGMGDPRLSYLPGKLARGGGGQVAVYKVE